MKAFTLSRMMYIASLAVLAVQTTTSDTYCDTIKDDPPVCTNAKPSDCGKESTTKYCPKMCACGIVTTTAGPTPRNTTVQKANSDLTHCLEDGPLKLPNPFVDYNSTNGINAIYWSRVRGAKRKEILLRYIDPNTGTETDKDLWTSVDTRAQVYDVWGLELSDVTVDDSGLYTLAVGLEGDALVHTTQVTVTETDDCAGKTTGGNGGEVDTGTGVGSATGAASVRHETTMPTTNTEEQRPLLKSVTPSTRTTTEHGPSKKSNGGLDGTSIGLLIASIVALYLIIGEMAY